MKSLKFFLLLLTFSSVCRAQSVNCPNASLYIHTGPQIIEQPIPLPASTSTVLTGLPPSASGLAVGPALGFPAPDPTFWTVSGGTYWYYNGLAWINTTHSTGNVGALNIGGAGNRLYNLVGTTGQIYTYDGTGNGSLLTTITAFGGNGPYDISADANNNFYLVKATTPNPSLLIYNAAGNLICTYLLANLPQVTGGGGFAIVNNLLAVYNTSFHLGVINAASGLVTFTAQPAITNPSDFANCVLSVPKGNILAPSGGTLDCLNNPLPLIAQIIPGGIGMNPGPASSTLNSCSYYWSGPGIVSGQGTSSISVNQPGIYTFTVCSSGCPVQQVVESFTIFPGPSVTPTITAPTCFHGPCVLTLSSNNAATISWSGPGISGASNGLTVAISSPGIYSVDVNNMLGCSGTQTVNVKATPSVSLALSSSSVCATGLNGSPVSLTLTPSGALSYTLLTGTNYTAGTSAPWVCSPVGILNNTSVASATIIGSNGTCSGSVATSFNIVPNPTVLITPSISAVCSGVSKTLVVSGASTYSWAASPALNVFTGAGVVATTVTTSIFSAFGTSLGCNSATQSSTLTILPLPVVSVIPQNTTICSSTQVNLQAIGSAAFYSWKSSSGGPSPTLGISMNVTPPASITYTVTGTLNTCTSAATATITTVSPPVMSITLSDNTVCAQPINGSPGTLNVMASGATNYTLLPGPLFNVLLPNGPAAEIWPNPLPQTSPVVATATLWGSNGYCKVATTQTFAIIPNPVITSLPSSAIICPGDGQLLSVSGASTYSWLTAYPGLDNYYSGNVTATPAITTVYSVIGESMGCRSAAQANVVNISPVPVVSVSVSSPTLCNGTSVLLKATGNSSSYEWLAAPGLAALNSPSVFASPSASGSYTVVGALNNCTNTAVVHLNVIPAPVLNSTASSYTVCSGSNVHLYVSGAYSYEWSPAIGPNTTLGQHIITTPATSTTYTVRGFNGVCTGTSTLFIKTIQNPDIKLDALANTICAGGFMPLKASGAQKYIWTPATGLSSANSPIVTASPAITTNYSITGVNSDGSVSCVSQISYSVIVLPEIKAVVSSGKNICLGGSTALSASGASNYKWTPTASLNKSSGAMVTARPLVSTIYTVEASHNGDCSVSTTISVAVHANPAVFAGRDTVYNLDDAIMIHAVGAGTLKWVGGDNIFCSDCPSTAVSPKMNNCYRVEATNEFGCKSTDDVCITLTDNFYVYIPNTFTPNGDGLNDVFIVSGVGILHVTMDVYDRWGAQVFSSKEQNMGWNGSFKGVDCKSGVYTYQVSYKGLNGKNFSKTGGITLLRE